jgi:hypothetical protein
MNYEVDTDTLDCEADYENCNGAGYYQCWYCGKILCVECATTTGVHDRCSEGRCVRRDVSEQVRELRRDINELIREVQKAVA